MSLRPPSFLSVWRRHARVWRKLMFSSLLGNFGEPVLYLLALGYGLGRFIGELDGIPYLVFLASGTVCSSAMSAAAFECTYSSYTRLEHQQTWQAQLMTPLSVKDIVLGEVTWGATKALVSAAPILLVAALLGLIANFWALLALPILFLLGLCFAAWSICVTALAKSYDAFVFYVTLILTPLTLLSGVFFPLSAMPEALQTAMWFLPLTHTIALVRPLMIGAEVTTIWLHLLVLAAYTAVGIGLAFVLCERRLRR